MNSLLVIWYNDVYLGCRKLFTDIGKCRINVHFTCKTTVTFCLFWHDADGSGSVNPQPVVIQDSPSATNNFIRSHNEISSFSVKYLYLMHAHGLFSHLNGLAFFRPTNVAVCIKHRASVEHIKLRRYVSTAHYLIVSIKDWHPKPWNSHGRCISRSVQCVHTMTKIMMEFTQ